MIKTKNAKKGDKNAHRLLSEAKGQQNGPDSGEHQKRVLCDILILFLSPNRKRSTIKAFPEVSLVSLTLSARYVL